jgi:integrase/recombinase XerD
MSNLLHPTPLDAAIAHFVGHQRVFGRAYRTEEYILRTLRRYVRQQGAHELNAALFDRWSRAQRALSSTTLYRRQLLVRKFCLFRRRSAPGCFVPDAGGFARPRPARAPVIVTPAQVAALLQAARVLGPSRDSPLRAANTRMALVLLYTAGLRREEVVRLRLADVDAREGVLHIRESKCHRSRWVPLSKDARCELQKYLRLRLRRPFDCSPGAALLCHGHHAYGHAGWHGYCGAGLAYGLKKLIEQVNVRDSQGRRPRLQDMRHSFAVQALVRWYRNGEDVQTQLPRLALFMGHVSIVSTAYYLHFIPEVAALAGERFGRSFSHLVD